MDGVKVVFGRLGEGVGFSHQPTNPCSQRAKPAFDMVGFAFVLAAGTVGVGGKSRYVGFLERFPID